MKKKWPDNILVVPLPMYRLHIIIAWDMPLRDAAKHCQRHGCELTEEWITEVAAFAEGGNGLCVNLGRGNSDCLIWMKTGLYRDSKASEYGTLYHEIFHAVDKITKSHNLHGEEECRAYIFEWIATECNKYFWNRKRPKSKRV